MKYNIKNQNGDAAEYFTAFKFTRLFGWPFRLIAVDLGIDGEFEIQDESGDTTGNIVKVQIKSVTGQNSLCDSVHVWPEPEHVAYWKAFCTPVIMCAVDVSIGEIYWQQINETNAYVSERGATRLTFSRSSDLLTERSASALKELVMPAIAHQLRSLLQAIQVEIGRVMDPPGLVSEPVGMEAGVKFVDIANSIRSLIRKAEELAKYYPWKLSLSDQATLEKARNVAKDIGLLGNEAINSEYG